MTEWCSEMISYHVVPVSVSCEMLCTLRGGCSWPVAGNRMIMDRVQAYIVHPLHTRASTTPSRCCR